MAAARELLAAERSEVRTLTGGVRAFIEVLEPPLRLLVCGAGHDAIPLTRAAAGLGWNAIVVDDRVGVPDRRALPARGRVRPRRGTRAHREDHPDRRTHVRGRDDPQLPAGQGVPALAAGFTGRLHRHAGSRRAHRATVDGAPRRRRHRSPTRTARASTARRAWTSAPKVRRRSRSRSSPRSSPSGAPAAAASSRSGQAPSTTGPHRGRRPAEPELPVLSTHAISGCCHRLSATARRANRTRRVHGVAFQFRVSPACHAGRGARCARLPRRRGEGPRRRTEPDPHDEAAVRLAGASGRHQPARGPRHDRGTRRRSRARAPWSDTTNSPGPS